MFGIDVVGLVLIEIDEVSHRVCICVSVCLWVSFAHYFIQERVVSFIIITQNVLLFDRLGSR